MRASTACSPVGKQESQGSRLVQLLMQYSWMARVWVQISGCLHLIRLVLVTPYQNDMQ